MASQGLKRIIAAGAAAVVLGVAAIGFVNAEPGPGGTPGGQRQGFNREAMQQRHEQYLTTLAGKLGVSVDKLRQAMSDTHNELGGPGGPRAHRGGGMGWFDLEAAAKAMNITRDQLRQELAGKTMAAVAATHSVPASSVSAAIKAAATTRIDQAVSANRMTADQASKAKAELDQKINDFMNRTFPAAGQRGPKPAGQ